MLLGFRGKTRAVSVASTSTTNSTTAGLGVAASAFLVLTFASGTAEAFCRSTTHELPPSFSPTSGCYTEGLALFWKNACVSYSVQQSGSVSIPYADAARVIDTAFATWSAIQCDGGPGITASNLGAASCSTVGFNERAANQNLIVFRDDTWPYSDPNSTLGLTTVTFNVQTGEILDADMEINNSARNLSITDDVPAKGFDLLSVVTHEAGHFFGLAHATDSRSTMFASYRPGTIALRTLTSDDTAGLCAIYPSSSTRTVDTSVAASGTVAAGACDPTPFNGGTSECTGPATTKAEDGGCSVGSGRSALGACGFREGAVAAFVAFVALRRRRRASID